jgi:transposase
VIAVPPGVRILLAAEPVDFRKGMDGLAALVQQALRADPFAGEVFIFRPRRGDRVKILVYDGTGLCLYAKRLEAGRFCWPSPADGVVRLSAAQLATLLEGHRQVDAGKDREASLTGVTALCGSRGTSDLGPDRESLRADGSVLGSRKVIAVKVKEIVDLVVGREEALCLAG